MWKVGDRIDNQFVIHEVKEGGMGVVYIVYDLVQRQPLAAKTPRVEPDTAEAGQRFLDEANIWLDLGRHQNVTQAHFAQRIRGRPFIFIEYVSGGSLRDLIVTDVLRNDVELTLKLALNFCDGMTHAYSKGLEVHRDIKPDNCLVTEDGVLKVTDFGIAKATFDDKASSGNARSLRSPDISGFVKDHRLTGTYDWIGTPPYMAPEQFVDAKNVTKAADIYAFGIMLFEMLTGRPPFLADSFEAFARLHLWAAPPRSLGTSSVRFTDLVFRCLHKKTSRRPQDFVAVRRILAKEYRELMGTAPPAPVSGVPLHAEEWVDRGIGLRGLGRPDDALRSFDKAIEIRAAHARALVNKGACLCDLGRYAEARDILSTAVEIEPGREIAWANLALALEQLGDGRAAAHCVKKAICLNPKNYRTLSNFAGSLARAGHPGEALTWVDHALRVNPEHAEAWVNRGGVLEKLGRLEEALACFKTALELNENLEVAAMGSADVSLQLDRLEDALDWYSEVLRMNPTNVVAVARKAELLANNRQFQDEIDCYQEYLDLRPADARVWTNKGVAQAALGNYEDALHCFDTAIQIAPGFADGWYNRGVTLRDSFRNQAEALEAFRTARRLGHSAARSAERHLTPAITPRRRST